MGEPCTRSEETGSCAGSGTLLSSRVVAEMSVAGLVEHGLVHHGLVRLCEVVAWEHQELGQGTGGDHLGLLLGDIVGDGLGLLVRLEEHRHLDLTGGERHDAQGVGDALGEVDRSCLSALPVVSLLEGDGLERLLPD